MTFRVIKPFLTGSIAIVHESNGTMLIVKESELEALMKVLPITTDPRGCISATMWATDGDGNELQTEEAEER